MAKTFGNWLERVLNATAFSLLSNVYQLPKSTNYPRETDKTFVCAQDSVRDPYLDINKEGRKELFYLTTHSTHFIYGYRASDIWLMSTQINSKGSFIYIIPQTGLHISRPLLHQSWSTGWNEK